MALNEEMKRYLADSQQELRQLIRELCAIPAPSGLEDRRAAWCKAWFERAGGQNVTIDQAKNVICPWGVTEHNRLLVVMAHMDTVFPDLEPLPFEEDEHQFRCPGVTDDTAQLAVLMLCARYLMNSGRAPGCGVLFVANACEEGLGNLKGSRRIVEDYGSRMDALVTIDGTQLPQIVNQAVGSHRYRVTVRTEGGHSFGAFGNRNAIRYLASIIDTLYTVKVPRDGDSKTTYNVGTISGGTSVNTIAQEAEMLFEYRSDSRKCLQQMEKILCQVLDAYRAMEVQVICERIGDRPCTGQVDAGKWQALQDCAAQSLRRTLGLEPQFNSGSTDCNSALAVGIPAICISGVHGGGCHTRSEFLDLDSLEDGSRYVLDFLSELVWNP